LRRWPPLHARDLLESCSPSRASGWHSLTKFMSGTGPAPDFDFESGGRRRARPQPCVREPLSGWVAPLEGRGRLSSTRAPRAGSEQFEFAKRPARSRVRELVSADLTGSEGVVPVVADRDHGSHRASAGEVEILEHRGARLDVVLGRQVGPRVDDLLTTLQALLRVRIRLRSLEDQEVAIRRRGDAGFLGVHDAIFAAMRAILGRLIVAVE
jgi:hypothetical protein